MKTNDHLDAIDLKICVERKRRFRLPTTPQVGDRVIFADGVQRRISYLWGGANPQVQTSDGGSWYLGENYVSFSGSLCGPIPAGTLTRDEETDYCLFWFFSHNEWRAHNGVNCWLPVRVWRCSLPSNT